MNRLQLLFIALSLGGVALLGAGTETLPIQQLSLVQRELPAGLGRSYRMASLPEDEVAFLDIENHRLLVPAVRGYKQVGAIGMGPGDYFYPEGLCASRDGIVFVIDSGNSRLEILSHEYEALRVVPLEGEATGCAVTGDQNVLLNEPYRDHLISVYSAAGVLKAHLGELLSPGSVNPELPEDHRGAYRFPLNRVSIALDSRGDIWLAFRHLARIRKYSQRGELLADLSPLESELTPLIESIWTLQRPPQAIGESIDGLQLTVVQKDIAFDSKGNRMLLLLGDDRIAALGLQGQVLFVAQQGEKRILLDSLLVNSQGELLASEFGAPRLYRVDFSGLG